MSNGQERHRGRGGAGCKPVVSAEQVRILPPAPFVGMVVCDCRYKHLKIIAIHDGGDLELEDGSMCSYEHCCDPVPHVWEHP